jgi:hypothetical protein
VALLSLLFKMVQLFFGPVAGTVSGWLAPAEIGKLIATALLYGSIFFGYAAAVANDGGMAFAALATALASLGHGLQRLLAGPVALAAERPDMSGGRPTIPFPKP